MIFLVDTNDVFINIRISLRISWKREYEGKSFILKLSIFLVFHLEGLEDVLL